MAEYLTNFYITTPLVGLPFAGVLFNAIYKSDENDWVSNDYTNFCEDGFAWNTDNHECEKIISNQG